MVSDLISDTDVGVCSIWPHRRCLSVWPCYPMGHNKDIVCETPRKSNFLKNGKMVISVKIRNFSRSQMTKRTSPLESSREI